MFTCGLGEHEYPKTFCDSSYGSHAEHQRP
jgi:hypothetical protein